MPAMALAFLLRYWVWIALAGAVAGWSGHLMLKYYNKGIEHEAEIVNKATQKVENDWTKIDNQSLSTDAAISRLRQRAKRS